MPKMKTHKSGAKRYKISATGKLQRAQAGRGHLNSKKSSKRKRSLEGYITIDSGNLAKVRLEIPYLQYIR
ncbi:MAG: 50S ribosomal protein L35 [Cyanobacteria bacterium]|nr:50S ribosomal protein L35 [Cyanobacteriota bacterium]